MIRGVIITGLAATLVVLISCNDNSVTSKEDGFAGFNADTMRQNIAVLASDSFLGRKPFTEGEVKTVRYLQAQFAAAGLEAGNGNSYLQEVPMVDITTTAAPSMEVKSAKGKFSLKGYEDYVLWTDKTDSVININDCELVFAGYGVVAPEYNWNDYADIDVKGKIVLILVNDPGFHSKDTSLFKGNTMTWYGRWPYKFEEAARQGAKGCLIIHDEVGASYPFSVVQNNWNASRLRLDDRGKEGKYSDAIGWISSTAAKKLLAAAGQDSSLLQKAGNRGFKAIPLNTSVSTSLTVKTRYDRTYNVIGKITGSEKPEEVIIYSAHWDHLGIGKANEKGDSIHNGAFDNATGTAGLIQLAMAFNAMKQKPKRTIVFLSVTAEEQGLWGSAWYARNPVYPVGKTACNINMDGLNYGATARDIVIVGKGQSDLEDLLTEEAGNQDRVVTYETHPEAGYYYRSDHFNFAKVGIPALYTSIGSDIIGKGIDYGRKRIQNYREHHYHRPSDEYDPGSWTMEGGIADLKLLFLVGKRVADADKLPQWKDGSEFKNVKKDE